MDIEQARTNMLTQQVRAWHVLDDRILDLLKEIPREEFVPTQYHDLAFSDMHIPIGHGQVMMTPGEEARVLQALDIQDTDKVLEVGTGSGYMTALMAKQADHVYSLEINPELATLAQQKLSEHDINNATIEVANGATGYKVQAPYDAIAITGSLPSLAKKFRKQLNIGGRMFVILGQAPTMVAYVLRRTGEDRWEEDALFETVLPPLQEVQQRDPFKF